MNSVKNVSYVTADFILFLNIEIKRESILLNMVYCVPNNQYFPFCLFKKIELLILNVKNCSQKCFPPILKKNFPENLYLVSYTDKCIIVK